MRLLDKLLDTVQPAKVFLLLLDINVLRQELCQCAVDATGVQVALNDSLNLLIQLLEWWARVSSLGRLANDLGGVLRGRLGDVRKLVDDDVAINCGQIELERTLACALDKNIDVNWVSWRCVLLMFC